MPQSSHIKHQLQQPMHYKQQQKRHVKCNPSQGTTRRQDRHINIIVIKRVWRTISRNTETTTERYDETLPKRLQARRRHWRLWRYRTISFVAMRYQGYFGYAAEPSRLGRKASLQRSNVLFKQLRFRISHFKQVQGGILIDCQFVWAK